MIKMAEIGGGRRKFLKGTGAAIVAATAGCLEDDGQDDDLDRSDVFAEIQEYMSLNREFYDVEDREGREALPDEEVPGEYEEVLQDVEDLQTDWTELTNDRMQEDDLYEDPLFNEDEISSEFYQGGQLDPQDSNSQTEGQYDISMTIETHPDGAYENLQDVDHPGVTGQEAQIVFGHGLETLASALIYTCVYRERPEMDEEANTELHQDFLEDVSGIEANIQDQHGNIVSAYMPEGDVDGFADRFREAEYGEEDQESLLDEVVSSISYCRNC